MKVFKNILFILVALLAIPAFAGVPPIKIGRALLQDFSRGRAGDVNSLVRFYSLNDNQIRDALAYLKAFEILPASKQVEAQELGIDVNAMDPLVMTLKIGLEHELDSRKAAAKAAAEAPFLNANEMELVAFLKPGLGIGKYPPAFEFERANSAQLRRLFDTIESVFRSNLKLAKIAAIADELRKSDRNVTNLSATTAMQTLQQQLPNQIRAKEQAERAPAQVPTQPRRY